MYWSNALYDQAIEANQALTGMPNYPAFARDTCFDRIRSLASFTQFMARLKPVWDGDERKMRCTGPRAVSR